MNASHTIAAAARTAAGCARRAGPGGSAYARHERSAASPADRAVASGCVLQLTHLALRLAQEPQHQEHADHGPDRQRPQVAAVQPGAVVAGIEGVLQPVGQRPDREHVGDVVQRLGQRVGREPDVEMKVSGRTARLTMTGPASAFGMNRVIPIPSVVNAAVPSSSVDHRPGSVDGRGSATP